MDVSKVNDSLPDGVALVALDRATEGDFEIFAGEEELISDRAVPQRVAEFRLGRRAAHRALLAIGCEPVPILRGEQKEPIWPPGFTGSLTHTGAVAIAAVGRLSDSAGIGIDLEDMARFFPQLEAEVAFSEELDELAGLDGRAKEEATLEIFSAKESIYKAFYPRVGEFFGFDAARIELGSDCLVGYFTSQLDSAYPVDRPIMIGRLWHDDMLLTWVVLAPE